MNLESEKKVRTVAPAKQQLSRHALWEQLH